MSDLSEFSLESDRLILRPLRPGDAAAFSAYRSDPLIARYQGWDAPYNLEKAEKFIEQMQAVTPGDIGQWMQLGLEIKPGSGLIGDVAFRVLKEQRKTAEIGMTLANDHHGFGYGFEAVTRLVRYLFEDLHLHRVTANTDPENHAAYHLLEKVGLRREGHFLKSMWFKGYWASEYWYAILDEEWLQRERSS
jgi:aminoglycoside 6'-N-acetyltransferase